MKKPFVLLVGDNCRDIYYYGNVNRISPEAPVPVLDYTFKEEKYGMAGNVWHNLEKLGCDIVFLTSGRSTKTRFVDAKTKQQLIRFDEDPSRDPVQLPSLHSKTSVFDAIVISDYDKGSVTYDTIDYIKKYYDGPVFIDTKKKDLARFEGMYVKINQKEYEDAISYPEEHLITTLGDIGASYKGKLYETKRIENFDVCGAGDTFFASFVYKFLCTKNIEKSIIFANAASSITVQQNGVYSPSIQEIEGAL